MSVNRHWSKPLRHCLRITSRATTTRTHSKGSFLMSNRHTSPPTDGPPIWPLHLRVLEASGEPADSPSMRNAQMTIARLSTYASARIYAGYLARFFAFMAEQGREPIAADHDDIDLYLMTQRHLSPKPQACQWGVSVGRDLVRHVPGREDRRGPRPGRTAPRPARGTAAGSRRRCRDKPGFPPAWPPRR